MDETADRGWCHAAPTTLLGHLRYCKAGISKDVQNRAENDHILRGGWGCRPPPIDTSGSGPYASAGPSVVTHNSPITTITSFHSETPPQSSTALLPSPLGSVYGLQLPLSAPPTPTLGQTPDSSKCILSITANLASCERLFSTFGATLTKLRNWLGTSTLQSLAELKMHICDQQLQKGAKDQIKQRFGDQKWAEQSEVATHTASGLIAAIAPTQPPTFNPQLLPVSVMPSPLVDPSHHDTPSQPTSQSGKSPDQDHLLNTSRLRALIDGHITQGHKDNKDSAPVWGSSTLPRIDIQTLFNFSSSHWTEIYSGVAKQNFDDELAFYDLINMDAPGEEDFEFEVDGTMQEVILGGMDS
ncbi:hypothetical protein PAXRUDRAFT_179237 [Paxillus rubicundulus Ve08.2h10]|uniref:Uncharacterized protein n=1 Tax=Paxillus rubicundulus Ve08.2h10 TaxID=930991 RepID=A0A0D0CC92_9AGAM|nr:hypothetical protein PAXRUDRAFT_179237 [Paxillus rubicundulus Ve08.2h10]